MGLARIGYEPARAGTRRRLGTFAAICATVLAFAGLNVGVFPAGADTNTGTIKIFDGDKELPANDPKACGPFFVKGLNFDPGELVDVTIEGQGGNAGPSSFADTVTVDPGGAFTTSPINLLPGQYKATADDGEGGDKHKVFKIECAPETPPTSPPTAPPGPPGEQAAPPRPGEVAAPPGPAARPPAPAARPPAPAAPAPAPAVVAPPRGVTG